MGETAGALKAADILYFAGVHVPLHPALGRFMSTGFLVALLRQRIQYNWCAYFGVCGGAAMAGAANPYNLPPSDFCDGAIVHL